jgi:hypothetical protein
MHRAVVLTTLVVLLLAVAGVSAAQESGKNQGYARSCMRTSENSNLLGTSVNKGKTKGQSP